MKRLFLALCLLLPSLASAQSALSTAASGMSAGSWLHFTTTTGWTDIMFYGNGSNSDMAYNMNAQWDSNRRIARWWTAIHTPNSGAPCQNPGFDAVACADETQSFNKIDDATNVASQQIDAVTGKYNASYAGDIGGHAWNEQTMDDQGNSYRCWHGSGVCHRFDAVTQTWSSIATNSSVLSNGTYLAMSWNPDARGLILITGGGGLGTAGQIWFWKELTNAWTLLFTSPTGVFTDGFSGVSPVTVYNPILHQIWIGGGADGSVRDHNFYLLSYTRSCGDPTSPSCWSFNFNGVNGVHTLPSVNYCGASTTAFVDSSGEVGNLVADPISGKYFRVAVDNSCNNTLWVYDPTTDNGSSGSGWTDITATGSNAPPSGIRLAGKPGASGGGAGNYFVSVPVPEYGVVMYIQQTGAHGPSAQGEIYLYKPNAHSTGGSAPSVPTSVHNTAKSAITAELMWTASSAGTNTMEGYKVYRDGIFIGYSSIPVFNALGLTPNTTYTFTVTSYDNLNQESSASSSVMVTTDAQLYSFSAKCALSGVLHCDGFDDVSTVTYGWPDPNADSTVYYAGNTCNDIFGPTGLNKTNNLNSNPYGGAAIGMGQATYTDGQCVYPQVWSSNKHSGAASLKFSVPNHATVVTGEYYGPFKDHGGGAFGYVGPVPTSLTNPLAVHEGNELWLQFYSYVDATMLNTVRHYAFEDFWTTASAGATTVTADSCPAPNTGYMTSVAAGFGLSNFIGKKLWFDYGQNFTALTSFTVTAHSANDCGLVLSVSPTPSSAGNVASKHGWGSLSTGVSANGWKQVGVYGDPGPSQTTCCGPATQVINNPNQTGVPNPYSYGSGVVTYQDSKFETRPDSTSLCQFASWPDPNGTMYPQPPCLRYVPNQWQEFTVHINTAAGSYNDMACPSTSTGLYELYIDGQLAVKRNDFVLCWGAVLGAGGANGLGQFNLSPYHTHSDPNDTYTDTYVLYDDLIISTSPIPMLSGSSSTYYTATTGNDSNTCTQATSVSTPKLTVAGGLSCLLSGDTLIIEDGTYAEGIAKDAIPSGVDASNRTTVRAANRGMVTLNTLNADSAIIMVEHKDFITIDGINADASGTATATPGVVVLGGDGSTPSNGSTYLTYQYGTIIGNIGSGCLGSHGYPSGNSHHITVSHATIHDCGYMSGSTTIHGLYVNWADSLIEYSTVYNTDGSCILIFSSDSTYDASNDTVNGNTAHDCGNVPLRSGSGTGQIWSNNVGYSGGAVIGGSAGVWVDNTNGGTEYIYNNTLYNNTGKCIHSAEAAGTIVAKNNICRSNSSNSIDGNGGTVTTATNTFTDPSFVNAGTANFHLQATSTAIGAGTDLSASFTTDADGLTRTVPWDLGAYRSSPCSVPDHLAFTSQPSNAVVGASVGIITVEVQDAGNNACASDTSTITLSKHSGDCTGMTLNGTVSGANTFTTTSLNMTVATGSCSLDATDGALTGATSSSFTISAAPVTPHAGHIRFRK